VSTDSPARTTALEIICVVAAALLFGAAFTAPMLAHLSAIGNIRDWDWQMHMQWVPFYTVTHFHQLPLWNPYECGGVPMLANPQSRFLTPFFLLHLLFGPVIGFQLEITLHFAIAWAGGYVLARVQGISPLASALCGSIYTGSSWLPLHLAVGHAVFLTSAYLPWIIACLWRGFHEHQFLPAAVAALLVALTLGEGGVYPVLQAFVVAALLAIIISMIELSYWPILVAIAFGAFSAGFAAFKLLPNYEMMSVYPRPGDFFDYTPLRMIFGFLFSRVQIIGPDVIGGQWEIWEYSAYIGPLAAALAVVGIAKATRASLPWLIAGVVFITLATGDSASYSPWSLLHQLPIFSSSRVAPRFLIPFTLTVGMMAAFGADFILQRFDARGRYLLYFLICAMLADFWLVSAPSIRHLVDGEAPNPQDVSATFTQVRDESTGDMFVTSMANEGSLNCYEYTEITTTALGVKQPGYRGEQYLLGPGTLQLTKWTPNALSYAVDIPAPTTIVINQNYDPSWRLIEGHGEVHARSGLLAIDLPAGRQSLRLEYRSRSLRIGAAISILTLLAALGLLVIERCRRFHSLPH